jgi:hypothetical protein
MSSEEKIETRDESEGNDVEAHKYVMDEPGGDDPERKRKRKQYEEPADPEGGDFGKRRK